MHKPEYEIPFEQAQAMLPPGDFIHTFVSPTGGLLVGADWSREDVLEAMKEFGVMKSGEGAESMNHGLVFFDGERNVFIETVKEKLNG